VAADSIVEGCSMHFLLLEQYLSASSVAWLR
jgi:hypothetical protein